MKKTKARARNGAFDRLEGRVVPSGMTAVAQNQAIVKDVTSFYSGAMSTLPALSAAYTGATDATSQATAKTNLTSAITADINDLATQLLTDLGPAAAQQIRLAITGGAGGGSVVTNTSGSASSGSLLNALLAITGAEPGVLATSEGVNLLTDLGMGAAQALAAGRPSFPASNFGSFSQTYFGDVAPLATQLQTDQAAASTPPTTAQQTAITNDITAIDTKTVGDVNALATGLVTSMGTGSTKAIQQIVTGVPTTQSGVTFTSSTSTSSSTLTTPAGTSMAQYGSLLATLQAIEADPILLMDVNSVTGIVSLFARI